MSEQRKLSLDEMWAAWASAQGLDVNGDVAYHYAKAGWDAALRSQAALAASGSESDANNPKDKCAWPTPWGTCEAYRHEHYPSSQHQFVEPQPPALPSREEIAKAIHRGLWGRDDYDTDVHWAPVTRIAADAVLALIEGKL